MKLKYTFGRNQLSVDTISKFSSLFLIFSIVILATYIAFTFVKINAHPIAFSIFKISTILFGIFSLGYAIFLLFHQTIIWVRILQLGLVFITMLYLIVAIQWNLKQDWLAIYEHQFILIFAVATAFLSLSQKLTSIGSSGIHPSILFVLSFIVLITISSLMLMLPSSTVSGISALDAIFTATSAATVTGLAVLDTEAQFTMFGKIIILATIQLGGLGVLTFTNLFSLLFKSSTSFKNHLILGNMINENSSGKVFKTLLRLIGISLLVEAIGAILIYFSIIDTANIGSKTFFAIFHSISAYCNAGFSTLSNGLNDENIRTNYNLQAVVMWLIVTGGIGYNIMINHFSLLKSLFLKWLCRFKILNQKPHKYRRNIDLNTYLVITTSSFLLIFGLIGFFILEYNGVLAGETTFHKIMSAAFNSVTPRTAGFNNVDMGKLAQPTLLFIIILMWIGASPGSTGGGIKTSTFAISMLNLLNQIQGKDNIVIKYRMISRQAVNQVNATILLSVAGITTISFFMAVFEPTLDYVDSLFEIVSAFSTVGLSVGITASLGVPGKILIIIAMFLGRVSFLTFLIGIYRQVFGETKKANVYYPDETVFVS